MELNYEQAKTLLDRAVAEKGADYAYPESEKYQWHENRDPMCSYYTEREGTLVPSCIIGQVIEYLGLRKEFLAHRLQYEGASGLTALRGLGVTLTAAASALLDRAQGSQDSGSTWGDALEEAIMDVEGP